MVKNDLPFGENRDSGFFLLLLLLLLLPPLFAVSEKQVELSSDNKCVLPYTCTSLFQSLTYVNFGQKRHVNMVSTRAWPTDGPTDGPTNATDGRTDPRI